MPSNANQSSAISERTWASSERGVVAQRERGADDYVWVDNARFISILAIVMRHTEMFESDGQPVSTLESLIIQFRGFGVLIFFVVSGFLMAHCLGRRGVSQETYWRNRLQRVAHPWLWWTGLFAAIHLGKQAVRGRLSWAGLPVILERDIFFDAYWFVPVLLFSLAVLLMFRRQWDRAWPGLLFLGCTALYALDRHLHFFDISATVAVFGYLLPVWLGIQLHRHFALVRRWVDRVPWAIWLGLFGVAFGAVLLEGAGLRASHDGYPYSVMNPATQVYSLVILALLLKLKTTLAPRILDVRKESYGIYLTHPTIASLGIAGLNLVGNWCRHDWDLSRHLSTWVTNPEARVGVWLAWCATIYVLSLLLTKGLRRSSWRWLVGNGPVQVNRISW